MLKVRKVTQKHTILIKGRKKILEFKKITDPVQFPRRVPFRFGHRGGLLRYQHLLLPHVH